MSRVSADISARTGFLRPGTADGTQWWRPAALNFALPTSTDGAKRRKVERVGRVRLSMTRPAGGDPLGRISSRDCLGSSVETHSKEALRDARSTLDGSRLEAQTGHIGRQEPNPSETFEMIRAQYLEALYISKTSLAYFAKGPLSRARATFQAGRDASMAPESLATFLEDSLPSLPLMDKKYRETIPGLVQTLPAPDLSDDDADDAAAGAKPGRKRKRKQSKPGRDGLYPLEEDFVRRWWRIAGTDAGPPPESRDELARTRIARLRVRETELQIIMILEALALRSSTGRKDDRSKRRQDVGLILELLVDKLCIWQSVSDEAAGKDRFGDFCTEVVMPL
ncbi:MAG: hypothetical protein M1832_000665 [Thelocarpon impressellum]|nr:MAG: hypothetical protein M1832_000665 [Thelocarpon impressellum]